MNQRDGFRISFIETAKRRIVRVRNLIAHGEERTTGSVELRSAASELRCLAGEAMMLDFGTIADVARVAEQAAIQGDRFRMNTLMHELEGAVGVVAAGSPS